MSQEDAATIRRAYELWNESGPAAVVEQFWAEDAVYREGPGWPDAGVYRGRAAALERMQSLIELVGPIEVRIDDLIDLGDGRLSPAFACSGRVQRATRRIPTPLPSCSGCETDSSSKPTTTWIAPPLSKPWGCGNRRNCCYSSNAVSRVVAARSAAFTREQHSHKRRLTRASPSGTTR
jgi:ketosteroid isomerase-like protein